MDPDLAELRERAQRWRKLVASTLDKKLAEMIINEAEALEAMADRIEKQRQADPMP